MKSELRWNIRCKLKFHVHIWFSIRIKCLLRILERHVHNPPVDWIPVKTLFQKLSFLWYFFHFFYFCDFFQLLPILIYCCFFFRFFPNFFPIFLVFLHFLFFPHFVKKLPIYPDFSIFSYFHSKKPLESIWLTHRNISSVFSNWLLDSFLFTSLTKSKWCLFSLGE